MTPLSLAADPDRSVSFLRDVVGYGLLPGETSDVTTFAELSTSSRAVILAWYWPQRGFDAGFDPFAEFAAVSPTRKTERVLHHQVRTLVGNRLVWFLVIAGFAAHRTGDELVGAVCWRATCSGDRLLAVGEGTQGLDFSQILAIVETLGLCYVDPLDDSLQVESWTTWGEEGSRAVAGSVRSAVGLALSLATSSLVSRIVRNKDDRAGLDRVLRPFEGFLPELNERFHRLSDREVLGWARLAFERKERLADRAMIGEVVAEVVVGPEGGGRARTSELLANLLAEIKTEDAEILAEALEWAAGYVAALPGTFDDGIDQGFGWLLLDRARLSERVDAALAELESIATARATIRKALNPAHDRRPTARAGDIYTAPAPGTRYRELYEALATMTDQLPTLVIDPVENRIHTATRGWIGLPPSAIRDRAWWSGSGQSSTGRPQVRAWRAAGYDTPRLVTNDADDIVSAQFPPLQGREDWIEAHDEDERLEQGQYAVPPVPNIPVHAVDTYAGPPVWRMEDDQIAALRFSFVPPRATTRARHPKEGETGPPKTELSSDGKRIDRLVNHLREHGETDRRSIEALFASEDGSLSDDLAISAWLPKLLAKASRQRQIANIGTRKHPRWVAWGSQAHLAGRLATELERDEHGERVRRTTAPKLAPGEVVPADMYRDVVRHAFPDLRPAPGAPGVRLVGVEQGEPFLTEDGLRAVLAGRRLTDKGVKALLNRIELGREAAWDAAAAAAAPEPHEMVFDEDGFFAALAD